MRNYKHLFIAAIVVWGSTFTQNAMANEKEYLWPKNLMPDVQPQQIAAMREVTKAKDFKANKYRRPYLDWYEAPAKDKHTGACMILISGGSYRNLADAKKIKIWQERLTAEGIQCVSLIYRTPRPEGIPYYLTAWEDGQRAVKLVRSEAKKRGYSPEKIGVIGMSAGSHLGLLLATSSETPAYKPIDELDTTSCYINWAILNAPAYLTSDGATGTKATR